MKPPKRNLPKIVNDITTDKYIELFDCNIIGEYDLEIGSMLKLEVWDGWKEFINACLQGL